MATLTLTLTIMVSGGAAASRELIDNATSERFQALEARVERSEARVLELERTIQRLLSVDTSLRDSAAVETLLAAQPVDEAPEYPSQDEAALLQAEAALLQAVDGGSLRSRKQATCSLGDLSTHLNDIARTCCPGNDCSNTSYPGASASCSAACGHEVEPFWDSCASMLGTLQMIPAGFERFYDTCMATLYPPGSCGTSCTQSTYRCRVMELNQACCSNPLNCPATRPTPLECPIGCGLLFPSFVSECGASGQIPSADMRTFQAFANRCLHADPADLIEYAQDLIDDGCQLTLPQPSTPPPPPALPTSVSTPLFAADKWMTGMYETPCMSFETLRSRLKETQRVCCHGQICVDGHGDSVMPRDAVSGAPTCTAACALVFHDMVHDCSFLLNVSMPADILNTWQQYDQICLASSTADARGFLAAISNASCCVAGACGCHDQATCQAVSVDSARGTCFWDNDACHSCNHADCPSVYLIGGSAETGSYTGAATPMRFDLVANAWTRNTDVSSVAYPVPMAPMPTPSYYHAVTQLDGLIYSIGGYDDSSSYSTRNQRYDPDTNVWATLTPMHYPRRYLIAETIGGFIYAVGGYDGSSSSGENYCERYDPTTDTWATKTAMHYTRYSPASAVHRDLMYVMGGYAGSYRNFVEQYDPTANRWTTKTAMTYDRYQLAAVVKDDYIYAIGGYTSSYRNYVERYDPSANTWNTMAHMTRSRDWLAAVVYLGDIYVFGGRSSSETSYDHTAEKYDIARNTWTYYPNSGSSTPSNQAKALKLPTGQGRKYGNYAVVVN